MYCTSIYASTNTYVQSTNTKYNVHTHNTCTMYNDNNNNNAFNNKLIMQYNI